MTTAQALAHLRAFVDINKDLQVVTYAVHTAVHISAEITERIFSDIERSGLELVQSEVRDVSPESCRVFCFVFALPDDDGKPLVEYTINGHAIDHSAVLTFR